MARGTPCSCRRRALSGPSHRGRRPVNLSRYDGLADMYLDYVRVYKEAP